MKCIIQIPCLNEENTLGTVIRNLPKTIPGIDVIETIVIDDHSMDRTGEIAKQLGVNHVIRMTKRSELAKTFVAGLQLSLKLGADIIVNTDGDNQYNGHDIIALVKPVIAGEADIVIGARPIWDMEDFSFIKKTLQTIGSHVVSLISRSRVVDVTSGFRAISRQAALKIKISSTYTYTIDMIMQARRKHISILSVPVKVNRSTRPSRLSRSIFSYLCHSIYDIVRLLFKNALSKQTE